MSKYKLTAMCILSLLKNARAIFRNFVKTFGTGARSKYRYSNWYNIFSIGISTFFDCLVKVEHITI